MEESDVYKNLNVQDSIRDKDIKRSVILKWILLKWVIRK
jgi:hypothetical protein